MPRGIVKLRKRFDFPFSSTNYPMKITKTAVVLSALFGLFGSMSAHAGDADFTLVNRTGYTLREIYLTASKSKSWGNDRMGDGYLENNRSRLFRFSDKSSCTQDLMVVFDDDGSDVVWEGFDLCEINKITLKYNRKTNTVSADTE